MTAIEAQHSKPVLITGAAGFVGARLVERANRDRLPLISVDELSHFSTRPEHRTLHFGETLERKRLKNWLHTEQSQLSAVFHMGACTDTTETNGELLKELNIEYSKMLWNWCSEKKVPLIYASSAATYGDGSLGYSDDEDKISSLQPMNPYGDSKQAFDIWALEQERQGNHPPIWSGFKFFNVYGFGERHKEHMASVFLKAFDQIRSTQKVRLFKSHIPTCKDGEQKRDFVSVDDVVDVCWFAWKQPISRGIYNLGTGEARSFLDLVNVVFQTLGKTPCIEFFDMPPEIRDQYQYWTQAEMKNLRTAGYDRPFLSLEEGGKSYINKLLKELSSK